MGVNTSLMVVGSQSIVPEQTRSNQGPCSRLGGYPAQLVRAPDHDRNGGIRQSLQTFPLAVTDELAWLARCGMLKSGLMSRENDLRRKLFDERAQNMAVLLDEKRVALRARSHTVWPGTYPAWREISAHGTRRIRAPLRATAGYR